MLHFGHMNKPEVTELATVDLGAVRGGIGFWGSFGLNIASKAIQGAMAGAAQGRPLRGAFRAALGATAEGLGAAAQGAAG